MDGIKIHLICVFVYLICPNVKAVTPEPESTVEPEGLTESTVEPEGGAEGEPESTVEPKEGAEGEPESTVEPEGEAEGEPESTVEPEGGAEEEPESTVEPKGGAEGEPESTVEPEGGAEGEPESTVEPEGGAEGEPESTVEPESETEPKGVGAEPEAEGASPAERYTVIALYSVIIVIILVGNIVVAITIIKNPNLRRNTSNLYLVSLVSARASIAVSVIPVRILGMFSEEYLGSVLCKICHLAATGSSVTSILSVVFIAVSKYIQATNKNAKPFSMRKSVLIIIGIWLFGFVYAIPAAVTNDLIIINTPQGSTWSCTTSFNYAYLNKYFIIIDIIFLLLVPLSIILICYTRVIKTLSRPTIIRVGSVDGGTRRTPDKQSLKAINMLITLTILFTICTASPMILKLYVLWCGTYFAHFNAVETSIYMFSYSNAWFNLVVFAYFRDDLRTAFVKMFKKNRVIPVLVAHIHLFI